MWLSQLGKTIQPSDVLFNLTKFSNTLSVGIASECNYLFSLKKYVNDVDVMKLAIKHDHKLFYQETKRKTSSFR